MNEFESYRNNLDVNDKHGLNTIDVNNGVIYSGRIGLISKQKNEEDSKRTRPLAAAILGLNNTAAPLPEKPIFYDPWTDIDAQEMFLSSKPTCYLILSKPGTGAYSLGEALSKKLNCIHLCPKNIITDEIEQNSPTGLCMDFNMKHNNVILYDNILKMLKTKLTSPAVRHRGYVISGFPLVTANGSSKYLVNSIFAEESIEAIQEVIFDVICNMKKKKPKKPKEKTGSNHSSLSSDMEILGEEEVEEEQEPEELPDEEEEEEIKVELPKFLLNACSDIIFSGHAYYNTKKAVLLQQLNALFEVEMKPDIIIYLTCSDKDLITKKSHKYLYYKSNLNTAEPFASKTSSEVKWPSKYTFSDYTSPFDSHTFNYKYSCRQPINFEDNSVKQMCNYKQDIYPVIESKLKDYEPNSIIKLDGRQSVHQMMHNVMERLLLMPIKTVIIPEPLYMEEPPEDMEEFWKYVEELNVLRSGVLSFKRYPSPWFNRCPVELKNRQSTRGNPKFAVTFAKHVYLLSTLNRMISFCRNPRPYLKLKYLEPTCRVIVIGTKSSGKTMVSECLSWLFDTPIINYEKFLDSERQKKYDTFAKTILSEIIATIEDARFATWQMAEMERFGKLDVWCKTAQLLLREYIPLLIESLKCMKTEKVAEEQEEEETKFEETGPEEIPNFEFLNKFNALRDKLSFLTFLDDISLCEMALINKGMTQYAPDHLRIKIDKPAIPALGDTDVMEAIAAYIIANELQKEIEPTPEELMNEIINVLTTIDTDHQTATINDEMYGKYIIDGFPSDPEYWSFLSESKLMPDYTVTLIENRELDADLIQDYKNIESSQKNHMERFLLVNDPLLKTKLLVTNQPDTTVLDMKIIVSNTLNNISEDVVVNAEANPETDLNAAFTDAVEKFKEEWDSVKLKIEEHDKCYIDVELENKSDIQVVEEMLLKMRKSFMVACETNEDEEPVDQDDEEEVPKDIMTYNDSRNLCETNIFCPIAYYVHGVLWEGKPEFGMKHDNRIYQFCKEEALQLFQQDVTTYQSYNKPFKNLPPLRICIIGCIGSGKTTLSKLLAKELGLLHIDFEEVINDLLMPKHFKKVGRHFENSFTDAPIDDEAVVEFQIDEDNENLLSDIMSNETELRRMVYNYFERGASILSPLMQKLITKLWFQGPYVNTGFILDGYPRLPADTDDMLNCFCIPDLIIEIEGSSEISLKRLSPAMFKTWKIQLTQAKERARQKLDNERKEWMNFITKNIVVKLIVDEVLENMFFSTVEPIKGLSTTESVIIDAHPSGSSNVDANLFNSYNEMIQEFPEPEDQSEWEKLDEVHERIDARIESIYETDDENIQSLKVILSEQRIRTVSINGTKSIEKVIRFALSKLTILRNRCESLFEQTFIVNTDIAELLILEGFCLMSKFNRMCPVYIHDNPNAIQNIFKISRRKSKIYGIIHRSYIYFMGGEGAVKKFRTNPLKYITNKNMSLFKEYPLRICVIGPPKSGKSSLAAKLAKRYGLICISRGMALRHMIEDMHWTELGNKIISSLSSGEIIDEDHIIKAIQTITIDHRTITYGFVLDGFPESASEAMELSKDGFYPNIVFDISSNLGTVLQNSQNEVYYDILKYKPPYSRPFIENRFGKWSERSYKIRDWINNDYQNIYVLNGNDSKWQCLEDAVTIINGFIPKVHNYLTNVNIGIVSAEVMCISNEIFQKRMTSFRNMCPLCLSYNVLKHSDCPVDRKGVVQYRNKFYWICADHINKVLEHPHCYLSAQNVNIPEIPAVVKTVSMDLVYENGICIVNYAENLPSQMIKRGSNKFAASYRGKTYLFCGDKCLHKFLAKPHMYADITVFKETQAFPKLSLDNLPNMGYLEQTVGNLITDACCSVNVFRPKYPGLTYKLSALLQIALYLKTHNPLIDTSMMEKYLRASKVYDARCRLITHVGLLLRSMDNPFACYPICCKDESKCDSGTVRKPSSFTTSSTKASVTITEIN